VLLVWATEDPISPLSVAHRLAQLLPRSRLVTYPSHDHWVARQHAAEVAEEIRQLVRPA
jgi:pimeloyl-ACP methyl ester carboxylesterase